LKTALYDIFQQVGSERVDQINKIYTQELQEFLKSEEELIKNGKQVITQTNGKRKGNQLSKAAKKRMNAEIQVNRMSNIAIKDFSAVQSKQIKGVNSRGIILRDYSEPYQNHNNVVDPGRPLRKTPLLTQNNKRTTLLPNEVIELNSDDEHEALQTPLQNYKFGQTAPISRYPNNSFKQCPSNSFVCPTILHKHLSSPSSNKILTIFNHQINTGILNTRLCYRSKTNQLTHKLASIQFLSIISPTLNKFEQAKHNTLALPMELEPSTLIQLVAYMHGDGLLFPTNDEMKYMYIACKYFGLAGLVEKLRFKFETELLGQMDQYVLSLAQPRVLHPGEVLNSIFDLPRSG